jgi:hypothetical protein
LIFFSPPFLRFQIAAIFLFASGFSPFVFFRIGSIFIFAGWQLLSPFDYFRYIANIRHLRFSLFIDFIFRIIFRRHFCHYHIDFT